MIQNKNKFLLLAIIALLCTGLSASDVDNTSNKEEVVSLARLKEFKKAHECENAKRNALVAAAQLSVFVKQNSTNQVGISYLNQFLIGKKLFSCVYNTLRFAILRSDNAKQDLAIQNSLATVHLRNAVYGAAEIAPATDRAIVQTQVNFQEGIKVELIKQLDNCPEEVLIRFGGKEVLKANISQFPSFASTPLFSNNSAPIVDLMLGLHKKYLARSISKEDKKLSKELFALMPPKTNAPTTQSLMFNVLSKCLLVKQAGVSKKEADKITIEMLAPLVAKLVVPVIIRP